MIRSSSKLWIFMQCFFCFSGCSGELGSLGEETRSIREEMIVFVSTLKLHHHRRQETRRITAAALSVLTLTCAVVVGFLLIAVWVSSSASPSDDEEEVMLLLDSNTARGASSLDNAAPLAVGAADVWRVWNSAQAGTRRGGRDVDSDVGEQVADKEKEEDEEETGLSASSRSEELSAADSETETATSEQSKSSTQQDLQQQEEEYKWKSCAWIGAQDYVPCLDNRKSYLGRNKVHKHFEHRSLERHCPSEAAAAAAAQQQQPKCLIPLPLRYKAPICWPESRDQVTTEHDSVFFFQGQVSCKFLLFVLAAEKKKKIPVWLFVCLFVVEIKFFARQFHRERDFSCLLVFSCVFLLEKLS